VALWLNESRGRRRAHGTTAYLLGVAATLRGFRPQATRIVCDGEEVQELETMMVAVCNASQYGGGMRIAPMADITDGLMDLCVVQRIGRARFVGIFPRVFRASHVSHSCFLHRRARRVRIETDPPQPVHIDGDLVAQTPVEFAVRPGVLRLLVPARP
jgi:diacylglycerol kinase family enzyme